MKENAHNRMMIVGMSIIVLVIGTVALTLLGRVRSVSSVRNFDSTIARRELSIAMFYKRDKKMAKDRDMKQKIRRLGRMFKSLSKKMRFREGELAFIRVNIAKRDMSELAQDYGVQQTPTFMLFDGGKLLRDAVGNAVSLTGFVTRYELTDFIESNFSSQLDEVIEEKAKIRKRRREEARWRSYYYPYYYPYHHYPYGGFGFGGYHGGFGFGFGGHRGGGHRGGGHRGGGHRGGGHRGGGHRGGGHRGGGHRGGGHRGGGHH